MTNKTTKFAQWQKDMGYSNSEAAHALGICSSWVKALKRGSQAGSATIARPRMTIRLAMSALKAGLKPYS